jgi:TolA-binding protein
MTNLIRKLWLVLVAIVGACAAVAGTTWQVSEAQHGKADKAEVKALSTDLGVVAERVSSVVARVDVIEAKHEAQLKAVREQLSDLTDGIKQTNSMIFRMLQSSSRKRQP